MNEQEKQLLLKDLCARLPYGVMVDRLGVPHKVLSIKTDSIEIDRGEYMPAPYYLDEIKPYLRPMSSMTEEEEKEYIDIVNYKGGLLDYALTKRRNEKYSIPTFTCCIQWLLKRHFDVNNLIPMNLALPAPEGMYN